MTSVLDDYFVDPDLSLLDKVRIQAQVLVPVLRALRAELGKDKADALVKQALRPERMGRGLRPRGRGRSAAPGQGGARHRRDALPLRRVLPCPGRARAGRAADLRGRLRHRLGGRGRGEPRPRPDAHAGRAELYLSIQVRAPIVWYGTRWSRPCGGLP